MIQVTQGRRRGQRRGRLSDDRTEFRRTLVRRVPDSSHLFLGPATARGPAKFGLGRQPPRTAARSPHGRVDGRVVPAVVHGHRLALPAPKGRRGHVDGRRRGLSRRTTTIDGRRRVDQRRRGRRLEGMRPRRPVLRLDPASGILSGDLGRSDGGVGRWVGGGRGRQWCGGGGAEDGLRGTGTPNVGALRTQRLKGVPGGGLHRGGDGQRRGPSTGLLLDELTLEPGCDGPVVALAGIVLGPLLLHKGLVQTEVVSDAILPSGIHAPVVLKGVRDPPVDLGEGQAAIRGPQDGHADQHRVTVRRFVAVVLDGRHLGRAWDPNLGGFAQLGLLGRSVSNRGRLQQGALQRSFGGMVRPRQAGQIVAQPSDVLLVGRQGPLKGREEGPLRLGSARGVKGRVGRSLLGRIRDEGRCLRGGDRDDVEAALEEGLGRRTRLLGHLAWGRPAGTGQGRVEDDLSRGRRRPDGAQGRERGQARVHV